MAKQTERPPSPGRLRYIALLSSELGYPEPRIDNDAQAVKELNALLAEKKRRQTLKQNAFAKAIYNTLAWHGEGLHYEIITRIVQHDYPKLNTTQQKVLATLSTRRDLFRKVSAGVYFLAGKTEGRTYPLM